MKSFHVGGLISLGLAIVLYLMAWIPGAFVLGILGVIIDIVGWGMHLNSRSKSPGS